MFGVPCGKCKKAVVMMNEAVPLLKFYSFARQKINSALLRPFQ
jgi:hypothetical protein